MNARTDGQPQFRIRQHPYGISYRPRHSPRKPWIVKFNRNKKTVYVGTFETKAQASLAAAEFLRNEA